MCLRSVCNVFEVSLFVLWRNTLHEAFPQLQTKIFQSRRVQLRHVSFNCHCFEAISSRPLKGILKVGRDRRPEVEVEGVADHIIEIRYKMMSWRYVWAEVVGCGWIGKVDAAYRLRQPVWVELCGIIQTTRSLFQCGDWHVFKTNF